eukprot:Rhum_TRINITY_DN14676_c13_g5::Rhum_TRINITY_DN14676_c13_g5_i1::g.108647::m.108647/K17541/SCYL2; SCY1-like protein 2
MDKLLSKMKRTAVSKVTSASDDLDFKTVTKGYTLEGEGKSVASGGHCMLWRCVNAVKDNTKERVTLHLASRRVLDDSVGKEKANELLDFVRKGLSQQARIIHPGTLKLHEGLREKGQYLAYATERVVCSLANSLGEHTHVEVVKEQVTKHFASLANAEKYYGLFQVAEALQFYHTSVGVAHLNVTPATIFITEGNDWKLGCFDFSIHKDGGRPINKNFKVMVSTNTGDSGGGGGDEGDFFSQNSDAFSTAINPLLGPDLCYAAPEFVRELRPNYCCDAFSFGCVVFEVLSSYTQPGATPAATAIPSYSASSPAARNQLLPVDSDVSQYNNRVAQFKSRMFDECGIAASETVRTLVDSPQRLAQPLGALLSQSPLFSDMAVKCLIYLARLPEKTESAKVAFLKDLYRVLDRREYTSRLVRGRVLPVLIPQLSQMPVQYVLPIVLKAIPVLEKGCFSEVVLPVIRPYLVEEDDGDAKVAAPLLLERLTDISEKCSPDALRTLVIPFVCRNLERNASVGLFQVAVDLSRQGLVEADVMNVSIIPKMAHVAHGHRSAEIRLTAVERLTSLRAQTTQKTFATAVFPVLKAMLQAETDTPVLEALRAYFLAPAAEGDGTGGGLSSLFTTTVITQCVLPGLVGLLDGEASSALHDARFDIAEKVCSALLRQTRVNREERRRQAAESTRNKATAAAAAAAAAATEAGRRAEPADASTSEWQSDLPILNKQGSAASLGSLQGPSPTAGGGGGSGGGLPSQMCDPYHSQPPLAAHGSGGGAAAAVA